MGRTIQVSHTKAQALGVGKGKGKHKGGVATAATAVASGPIKTTPGKAGASKKRVGKKERQREIWRRICVAVKARNDAKPTLKELPFRRLLRQRIREYTDARIALSPAAASLLRAHVEAVISRLATASARILEATKKQQCTMETLQTALAVRDVMTRNAFTRIKWIDDYTERVAERKAAAKAKKAKAAQAQADADAPADDEEADA